VLFPPYYAAGARRYSEQFPTIPAVLLEGRVTEDSGGGNRAFGGRLAVYRTDTLADCYVAGLCAGILNRAAPGRILFFQDARMGYEERDAFSKGQREQGAAGTPQFLNSFSELSVFDGISCVILAGSGREYLEKNLKFPVILFSWLDPALSARETVLVFDDSPWALAVPAIRLLGKKAEEGLIPSDILFFPDRIADKEIRQSFKKTMQGFK
jgi:hypothetical protein